MIVRFVVGLTVVMVALWLVGWILRHAPLVLVVMVIAGAVGRYRRRTDA
ncbi:MAG: hypothetical protein ACYCS7_07795 [Acidimicrobiales bacterium]